MNPSTDHNLHTYHRVIAQNDSLAIIAQQVLPGSRVLDLGLGAGALGKLLTEQKSCRVDGVTLNEREAELARPWYAQVMVADLENMDMLRAFEGQQYDYIVCADVLEHLRQPERVLAQCRKLLPSGGRLLASVPNVGHVGLIAELMQGEFEYRAEGLLDRTHLRFFTRTSLKRFFNTEGWRVDQLWAIQRTLGESEFRTRFETLPPAVQRHLLTRPDALTYQFVCQLMDGSDDNQGQENTPAESAYEVCADFSSQLYWNDGNGYIEARKIVRSGAVGQRLQRLEFTCEQLDPKIVSVRWDVADRPGYATIYQLSIRLMDGTLIWAWESGLGELGTLGEARTQELILSRKWMAGTGCMCILLGDDPWLELPIPKTALEKLSGKIWVFEAVLDWPKSSDYLAAIELVEQRLEHELARRIEEALMQHQTQTEKAQREVDRIQQDMRILERHHAQKEIVLQQNLLKVHANYQQELNEKNAYIRSILESRLFRMTRPLVHMMIWARSKKNVAPTAAEVPAWQVSHAPPANFSPPPIDVIVPVYRGLIDTKRCIESVLASDLQSLNWRLLVINDASPEPELTQWLRDCANRHPQMTLLENAENLGFVGTVNLGMRHDSGRDVVLLNSDTEVANDWLVRLQRAAYAQERVATVTPFSNNATICSYPKFCQPNDLPVGMRTADVDALCAKVLGSRAIEIPTGVGFCMYIRRAALQEMGDFDETTFGKGYGEENDFCMRALKSGWRNLHALDVFVRHVGGVSFGESKSAREQQAMLALLGLHPDYETLVQRFIAADPAADARRLLSIARVVAVDKPVVLHVLHNRGGGTLKHVLQLVDRMHDQVRALMLQPTLGGVQLSVVDSDEVISWTFARPAGWQDLRDVLLALGVAHVHFHHLLDFDDEVLTLAHELRATHDFTVHDYYAYCPQISLVDESDRYCGERGLDQCRACVAKRPAPNGLGIESWRQRSLRLLQTARNVYVPSRDAAQRMLRFSPQLRLCLAPHSQLYEREDFSPIEPIGFRASPKLKVVVLGALSRMKGADVLEEVARLAAQQSVEVEFHLLGYAYRNLKTQPKVRLTVHGSYEEADLPQLLQWLQPDVAWFPAQLPETYSFTLSEALAAGLPVIGPDIGAFADRLKRRAWSWVVPWNWSGGQWVDCFKLLRQLQKEQVSWAQASDATQALIAKPLQQTTADDIPTVLYRESYVDGLTPPVSELAQPAALLTLMQTLMRTSTPATTTDTIRTFPWTVRVLARLRRTPVLSAVARRIPSHLQRRVRSWLSS